MTAPTPEGQSCIGKPPFRVLTSSPVSTPPRAFDLPQALSAALHDRYALEAVLGSGGMATVYKARDLRHDRFVAIKVLDRAYGQSLGIERFQREIRIAARLSHPNILPVYDSGEAAGDLWYVMPFVPDGSLRDRLRREPQLSQDDTLRIARDVAGALAYAHGQGVIHRDIKPENILFESGRAVVGDFGIARVLDPDSTGLTSSGGLAVGTPSYMSPEQATAHPQLDGRTDQYSLGIVLYEMLAGSAPFAAATPRAVLARHVQEPPPPLRIVRPGLPQWLLDAVERTLAKVPADRYPDLAAFDAVLAAGSSGALAAWTPRRRARWPLIVGGIAAGVAMGVVVRAVTRPEPTDPRRIAVQFFDAAGGDTTARNAGDAITADLAMGLASVESLSVRPLADVRPLRAGTARRLRDALGVRWVVTGSVAGVGDSLLVSAGLVDADEERQVTAWRWRAAARSLLSVQDSVSDVVARELRRRVGLALRERGSRAETRSVDAWERTQRGARRRREGSALAQRGDSASAAALLGEAKALLREAAERDPRWAEPWLELALLKRDESRIVDAPRAIERNQSSVALADSALALRPGWARALVARGDARFALFYAGGHYTDTAVAAMAERDLRAAAAQVGEAQPAALASLSFVLRIRGRPAEAHEAARRSYLADAYLASADQVLLRLCDTAIDIERAEDAQRWCSEGRRRFGDQWLFAYYELLMMAWDRGPAPSAPRTMALLDTL